MGAKVSRFSRFLRKPLETQGRIDKILESKPISAPKHPSSREAIEKITSETQEDFKIRDRKDEKFLNALKDFKVDSTDVKMDKSTSSRPLPQERIHRSSLLTTEIAKGKISSQNLNELFEKHLNDPTEWTEQKLSNHYKLNEQDVETLLKYFSGYAVVQKRELPKPLEEVGFID